MQRKTKEKLSGLAFVPMNTCPQKRCAFRAFRVVVTVAACYLALSIFCLPTSLKASLKCFVSSCIANEVLAGLVKDMFYMHIKT